jgi:hypothetical protein
MKVSSQRTSPSSFILHNSSFDLAVAEGFEPSHGRINSAVPYQLGYATMKVVAGAGVEPADSGL